jgi:hypothetical protein
LAVERESDEWMIKVVMVDIQRADDFAFGRDKI